MVRRGSILIRFAILALVFVVAGCGAIDVPGVSVGHPITNEAEAIAMARKHALSLRDPIRVTLVKSGTIIDIYDGAYPSFPSEEMAREWRAKMERPGWRVDFVGNLDGSNPGCPGILIPGATVQVVLDAETGEYVTGVSSQPNCPGQ